MENLIERIETLLTVTPARWQSLTQALPVDLLTRRPAPSEWSAVECLLHLVDTEQTYQFRVKCFLEGRDFPNFDPGSQGTKTTQQTPVELADEFARLRRQSLQSIAALVAADLDRSVRHQELGPVTLRQMLSNWAAHDLNHTIQAERALIQPLLPEVGPWIVYYQDHRLDHALDQQS
jgi:hypothetical protein